MSRLTLTDVSVSLDRKAIVQTIRATFDGSGLVALLGPNGAGKTTLLRAIAGLQPVKTGAIRIDGQSIAALGASARARRIGYLPQGHQTHWPLPVRDIVALGRFAHGVTDPRRLAPEDTAIVDAAMAQTGVAALADADITTLSGGEKARVALARVLATRAPILLADEPTASLDPGYQLAVMELLREVACAGTLVIAVTHDLDHALRFADRALVLSGGRLIADGTPADALNAQVLADVFGLRAPTGPDRRWEPVP